MKNSEKQEEWISENVCKKTEKAKYFADNEVGKVEIWQTNVKYGKI